MRFHKIMVGNTTGAVTAFSRDPFGNLFGLSAAHVLAGGDYILSDRDLVEIWDGNEFNLCGHAYVRTQMGNSPYPHEFGQVDAGLFTINNTFSQYLYAGIQPLQFSP